MLAPVVPIQLDNKVPNAKNKAFTAGDLFLQNVRMYKQTAEGHHGIQNENTEGVEASAYQISFTDDRGEMVTKRFEHVENTGKGKLLHNQVTAALDSMGRSISTQEKRQILMEILKTMC